MNLSDITISFPLDIFREIFGKLHEPDLGSAVQVCKGWNHLVLEKLRARMINLKLVNPLFSMTIPQIVDVLPIMLPTTNSMSMTRRFRKMCKHGEIISLFKLNAARNIYYDKFCYGQLPPTKVTRILMQNVELIIKYNHMHMFKMLNLSIGGGGNIGVIINFIAHYQNYDCLVYLLTQVNAEGHFNKLLKALAITQIKTYIGPRDLSDNLPNNTSVHNSERIKSHLFDIISLWPDKLKKFASRMKGGELSMVSTQDRHGLPLISNYTNNVELFVSSMSAPKISVFDDIAKYDNIVLFAQIQDKYPNIFDIGFMTEHSQEIIKSIIKHGSIKIGEYLRQHNFSFKLTDSTYLVVSPNITNNKKRCRRFIKLFCVRQSLAIGKNNEHFDKLLIILADYAAVIGRLDIFKEIISNKLSNSDWPTEFFNNSFLESSINHFEIYQFIIEYSRAHQSVNALTDQSIKDDIAASLNECASEGCEFVMQYGLSLLTNPDIIKFVKFASCGSNCKVLRILLENPTARDFDKIPRLNIARSDASFENIIIFLRMKKAMGYPLDTINLNRIFTEECVMADEEDEYLWTPHDLIELGATECNCGKPVGEHTGTASPLIMTPDTSDGPDEPDE